MNCPVCGSPLEEGVKFCTVCGTKLVPAPAQPTAQQPPQQPVRQNTSEIAQQYRPLGPWAYLGLNILFAIPIIGFIFLLVFTFSDKNINRRNYARSYWCALLVVIIIAVVFFSIAYATGAIYDIQNAVEEAAYTIKY